MNTKTHILLLFIFFSSYLSFSQIDNQKPFQVTPYIGFSNAQGDFDDFADNGSVFGIAIDKYISSKFALGLDLNFQSNSFVNPFDYSNITSPNSIMNLANGKWKATTLTIGPTYRLGSSKFNAEIYLKFGLLYIKSPTAISVFETTGATKDVFTLPEQERSGFGTTSGIRLNYQVSKKLSLFINSQYVYGSANVEYCDCGIEGLSNPDDIIDSEPVKKTVNPSYLNLNTGLTFNFGKTTNSSPNRNFPICDISLVELQCDAGDTVLLLNEFWSNFNPNYTRTVEVFNGNTLINPTTSSPRILSQNYGNIPFYLPIASNLIGNSLDARIKIMDTNGDVVCTKNINFIVPQCSPPPLTCSFILDTENPVCDANTITYTTISNWANAYLGSIVDIEAKDQSGALIPITILPSGSFPFAINASNTSGSITNSITIPSSYIGTPINVYLKMSEPTTGFVKNCAFSDLFTPNCQPSSSIVCDWTYNATCDSTNKGLKIDVTSNWSNAPIGSTLRYKLIDLNGGGNIPFTATPNNLPQSIVTNGSSSHTLFINNSFNGAQVVFKMEIVDSNGVVICNNGMDMTLPTCVFESCEPSLISASCNNGVPTIDFSVPWTNFPLFNSYSIYADIYDSNTSGANIIASITPFGLTSANGNQSFSVNLPLQYAGTTIYVKTRICETGSDKKCCPGLLVINVPECCEICDSISIIDNTDPNQKGEGFFKIFWAISNITTTPVTKISLELESFGVNNSTSNQVLPSPNFEITGAGVLVPTIAYNANAIGSLNGGRSNLWVIDFPTTLFTGGSLVTVIEKYDRKIVMNYLIRVTLYKTDGTYCERIIDYRR